MIRVGLVDGALPEDFPGLGASRLFCPHDGAVAATHHATAMAATIASHAPDVGFLGAVVFAGRLATSLQSVCDALHWLAADPPDIVLCSFGMANASLELLLAAARLQQAGCVIVASAPARGAPVFPAAFDDVISVQGDARCRPDEISRLDLPQAAYGASPVAHGHPDVRGASAAAAHLAGLLAGAGPVSIGSAARTLGGFVRYTGCERKTSSALPA